MPFLTTTKNTVQMINMLGTTWPWFKTQRTLSDLEQGLEPALNCADGIVLKSKTELDYRLRCKLAGVVVNYAIQTLGLQ